MPTVTVTLDKEQYDKEGDVIVATVVENSPKRTLVVTDSSGVKFTKKSDNGSTAVFEGKVAAAGIGSRTITVTMTDVTTGDLFFTSDSYVVGPQQTTLFCGSLNGDDGGLNLKLPGRRVFDDGTPPAKFTGNKNFVTATQRISVGGYIWMSFKGAVDKATYQSFINSASDYLEALGMKGFLSYEHEPEIKGAINPKTYHNGYDIIDPLCEGTLIEPVVVQTGFLGDAAPGKGHPKPFFPPEWETYYRANHKRQGFDHYNQAHGQDSEKYNDWQTVFGNVNDFALSKGKRLLIGETGAGQNCPDRAKWYTEVVRKGCTASGNMDAVFAFDARDTLHSKASATAMYS